MNITTICEIILTLIQILILAYGIVHFLRFTGKGWNAALPALFIFALLNLLMCNLYWLAYDVLRPDQWMPIAADEIAEAAGNLLLAGFLGMRMGKAKKPLHVGEFVFSLLFMEVNAFLWAEWSDEWIQSFLVAIPYIFLLYRTIRGLNLSDAASKRQKGILLFTLLLIIALHYTALMVEEETAWVLDRINYAIMAVPSVLLLYLFIKAGNSGSAVGGKRLYLSVLLYLWTMLASFMSNSIFYSIALAETDLSIILIYMAVAKEIPHDDPS